MAYAMKDLVQIQPGPKTKAYGLEGVPGIWLRVTPRGAFTWVWRGKFQGREKWVSIGAMDWTYWTVKKLRAAARKFEDMVAAGEDPSGSQAPEGVVTIQNALDIYCQEYLNINLDGTPLSIQEPRGGWKKARSYARVTTYLWRTYIPAAILTKPLVDFNVSMVDSIVNPLKLRVPPTSIKVLAALSGFWKFSARRYHALLDARKNPCRDYPAPAVVISERVLAEAEVRKLGDVFLAFEKPLKWHLLWLLLTGSRVSGITEFDPGWVTEFEGTGIVYCDIPPGTPGVKGARTIIMCAAAQRILPRIGRADYNQMHYALKCWAAKAEVPSVTPHTLRKTFGSLGVDWGEMDTSVHRLLNHAGSRLDRAYLRRTIPALQAVAERIGAKMMSALGLDINTILP